MSTSVTFDWAGAVRDTPRAATTRTARAMTETAVRRMRSLQTGVTGGLSLRWVAILSQVHGRGELAGDPAWRESPRGKIGELWDREVGAGHHHGDVARL